MYKSIEDVLPFLISKQRKLKIRIFEHGIVQDAELPTDDVDYYAVVGNKIVLYGITDKMYLDIIVKSKIVRHPILNKIYFVDKEDDIAYFILSQDSKCMFGRFDIQLQRDYIFQKLGIKLPNNKDSRSEFERHITNYFYGFYYKMVK